MKIQYIAVVFIIIILPITIVMTSYINSQIDTINLQSSYNAKLTDSTYDAVKALQINTVNNRYSSISDSKIRDIEAAVNTFYTSLSNNEDISKDELLKDYVPALVFTLYDGYYIYSKYSNAYSENNGQPITDDNALKQDENTNYGLKPYIYYSCRYKNNNGSKDFVVNYTLDNAITLYGTFGDGKGYQTLSGYLINPDAIPENTIKYTNNPLTWELIYDGIEISAELLTEHLLFLTKDENGNYQQGDYDYLIYNGQKIYYDKSAPSSSGTKYFLYQNYSKVYITNSYANIELVKYLTDRTNNNRLYSTSSFEYYYKAREFSKNVQRLTSGISQKNAINEEGNLLEFSINTGDEEIFVASNNNDPLISGSNFNENRMAVIRKSIETNLTAAIANYNLYSGGNTYEFALPVLEEEEWAKITNKVSMISFLQGISIGHKYYNNYCVITNDNNEETINKENIYIVAETENKREYHLPGCHHLAESKDINLKIKDSYSNLSFLRQTVRISEGNYLYFYPQTRVTNPFMTACYYCIINAANVYSVDEIIEGKIIVKNEDWKDEKKTFIDSPTYEKLNIIREYYIRALGRERYDLYQVNLDAFNTDS